MERVLALAKTHPLVSTLNPHKENLLQDRVLDDRGRAISGDQSNFFLSPSLAVSGKVMHVGISTRQIESSFFGLWWAPKGSDLTEAATKVVREVFCDLMELDSSRVFPVAEDKDWASAPCLRCLWRAPGKSVDV